MACEHLKQLYDLCETHHLRLSSSDLIRIVCPQCGIEEVCPSMHAEEYEARQTQRSSPKLPDGSDSGEPAE